MEGEGGNQVRTRSKCQGHLKRGLMLSHSAPMWTTWDPNPSLWVSAELRKGHVTDFPHSQQNDFLPCRVNAQPPIVISPNYTHTHTHTHKCTVAHAWANPHRALPGNGIQTRSPPPTHTHTHTHTHTLPHAWMAVCWSTPHTMKDSEREMKAKKMQQETWCEGESSCCVSRSQSTGSISELHRLISIN